MTNADLYEVFCRQLALVRLRINRREAENKRWGTDQYNHETLYVAHQDEEALYRVADILLPKNLAAALLKHADVLAAKMADAMQIVSKIQRLTNTYGNWEHMGGYGEWERVMYETLDAMEEILGPPSDDYHDGYDQWRDYAEKLKMFVIEELGTSPEENAPSNTK